MLEYSELKVFASVAKHLNFSKAARDIGLSAPQITKVVASLETKIKCKLLNRTTRNVRLTSEGQTFLIAAAKALNSMNEASQLFEMQTRPQEMQGTIRVTAPNTLGTRFLAYPLSLFSKKYPKVQVEILLADQYMDFVEDEIDVALRIMKPMDSSLIAKKIADNPVSFYASPGYLKNNDVPKTVADLLDHPVFCIPQHTGLTFQKAQITVKEAIHKNSIQCSNGDLLAEIACQDNGILIRSEWGVEREMKTGELVKIHLDDRLISETGVYVVYPKHKYTSPKVRGFIETMVKAVRLSS